MLSPKEFFYEYRTEFTIARLIAVLYVAISAGAVIGAATDLPPSWVGFLAVFFPIFSLFVVTIITMVGCIFRDIINGTFF